MEEQPSDAKISRIKKPRFECISFSIADAGSPEPVKAVKKRKKGPPVSVDVSSPVNAKLIKIIEKLVKGLEKLKEELQKPQSTSSMLRDGSLKRPSAAAGE